MSVMYCSSSGRAFGPVFDDNTAEEFVDWMIDQDRDPRDMGANTLDIWVTSWNLSNAGAEDDPCEPSAA
jgi:hypothetical protein